MKVFLEQSPFSYLSQFSPCRPSVLCHRSLTFPGVGIKWSILPPLSLPHSPSASAYLCSTFLGWALLVTSVQPHALLLTPAEHFVFGLLVLALAGKDYCSPYPSFRFWGSRYLCKHFPSFLTSLVTDMSLFVGQLWHCKSYFVFLSSWQLTREYISFYSSVNIPVIVATDMFHFTAYIIYIRTKNYQHKHFGELEFNYRLSNPW